MKGKYKYSPQKYKNGMKLADLLKIAMWWTDMMFIWV